jgi:hypothetical protein
MSFDEPKYLILMKSCLSIFLLLLVALSVISKKALWNPQLWRFISMYCFYLIPIFRWLIHSELIVVYGVIFCNFILLKLCLSTTYWRRLLFPPWNGSGTTVANQLAKISECSPLFHLSMVIHLNNMVLLSVESINIRIWIRNKKYYWTL